MSLGSLQGTAIFYAEDRATALRAWRRELCSAEDRKSRYVDFYTKVKGAPPKARRDGMNLHFLAATNDLRGLRSALLGRGPAVAAAVQRSASSPDLQGRGSTSFSPSFSSSSAASAAAGGLKRVDVDERDGSGQTALHHAVSFGALDAAALLLSAGWDPCVEDYRGRLPIDVACQGSRISRAAKPKDKETADLHVCAMVLLLLLFGAQPPPASGGWFLFAAKRGALPIASVLCLVWPSLCGTIREVFCWEPKESDFLRNFSRFLEALPAAIETAKIPAEKMENLRLQAAIMLVSLVLEAQLVHEVLPALPTSQAEDDAKHAQVFADVAGVYRYEGRTHNDRVCLLRDAPEGQPPRRAVWQMGRWAIIDAKGIELCTSKARDGPLLGSTWCELSIETISEQYPTFSTDSFFPPLHGPGIGRAPFVGLLNPHSGNKMGASFLEEARNFPCYRPFFFNIIHVATRPAALAAFRRSLEAVKAEAKARGARPRLISGGGDGTASFAIWVAFRALRVVEQVAATPEAPRAAATAATASAPRQLWRWSDEELRDFFPALVQMPLGTGNDLAGVLGWGRAITPLTDRGHAREWLANAFSLSRIVVPFDVWGMHTLASSGLKVCSPAALDKKHPDRPKFQAAGPSVPFLCLLYFSMGYEAYIAGQVEVNRQDSRLMNFLEYGKAIPATMMGSQRRNIDLTGIRISVPPPKQALKQPGQDKQYFPPEGRDSTGSEYATVGCMNINSFGGGTWSATEPAKFGDGLVDLFRQRSFVGNYLRRGRTYDTEKHSRATFRIPAELPGVHMQVDGEARFLFHPEQEAASFDIARVMQLPAVLGPDTLEIPMGASAGWQIAADRDAPGADAAFIPATDMDECKALCVKHGFGGFCIFKRRAYFREERPHLLRTRLTQRLGATFYIRDENAKDVRFAFTSPSDKRQAYQEVLSDWVQGKYMSSINATQEEVDNLQTISDNYARGICARGARAYVDFKVSKVHQYGDKGVLATFTYCAQCGCRCGSWGCQGCRRPFCKSCFKKHRGDAPSVQWTFADTGFIRKAFSLSPEMCLRDAQSQLKHLTGLDGSRKISLVITSHTAEGKDTVEETCDNPADAASYLKSYEEGDQQLYQQPRSLVTFHRAMRGRSTSSAEAGTNMLLTAQSMIPEEDEEEEEEDSKEGSQELERLESFLESDSSDGGSSAPEVSPVSRQDSGLSQGGHPAVTLTKSWQQEAHEMWKPLPKPEERDSGNTLAPPWPRSPRSPRSPQRALSP